MSEEIDSVLGEITTQIEDSTVVTRGNTCQQQDGLFGSG